MRTLLVTGGAGFIGANFVRYWITAHPADRLIVLDALTYAGNRASLAPMERHPGYRFVHGDICDGELVGDLLREEQVTTVVHFAAESHVDRSITGPDAFIRTNILGTHTLLKAARAAWSNNGRWRDGVRFHHVSTDEVYGSLGAEDPAFTEESPYCPNSPYSASKAGSDHLVRAYHHTYGLPATTSNCSNNYGPYQYPEKLLPLMLVHALEGKALPVYGRGENVRDWLYVTDHCRGIERVLESGRVGATYNIGGANEWRNIDTVKLLCGIVDGQFAQDASLSRRFPRCPASAGRPCAELISFVTDRPGHDLRYAIDASLVRRELHFEPAERFESGVEKTVRWYLANEEWWRPLLDRKAA
jgi:dTDP-glucose 4,6-dehydratase